VNGWEGRAEAWVAWARVHDDGWSALCELLPAVKR
jgi:hypothetical protein